MSEATLLSPLTHDPREFDRDPIATVFPTHEHTVSLPFQVNKTFLEQFADTYPGYKAVGTTLQHSHPHLNIDRKVMEEMAVRLLRRISDGWIFDVGGSSLRHKRLKRRNIWSCQPLIDPEDFARGFDPGLACRHVACECYCRAYDTVMLIHSLYYIPPEMLLELLVRSVYKMGVAVVHLFPDRAGTLGFNEASYTSVNNLIEMHVRGNFHTYVHDNIMWLKSRSIMSRGFTLTWTVVHLSLHSHILAFRVHTGVVRSLSRFLEEDVNEEITVRTRHKRGFSLASWYEESSQTAAIPKKLLTLLQRQRIGRPVNPQTYQLLIHTALRFLKETETSSVDIGKLMLVAVGHVMQCDVNLEQELLTELCLKHDSHEFLAELLAFPKKQQTWLNYVSSFPYALSFILPWQVQLIGYMIANHPSRTPRLMATIAPPTSRFDDPTVYTQSLIEDITSPRTHDLQESQLNLNPIDDEAKINYDIAEHRAPQGILKPIGITFGGCAPVAYAGNLQNEIVSVNNRALAPKPVHDVRRCHELKRWLKNGFDKIFPNRNEIIPNFDEWNERYPVVVRRRHEEAKRNGGTNKQEKRKAFVKVEKLLLARDTVVTDKAPRLIQGAVDEYNIEIGPWMYAFSKELTRIWNKDFMFFYPSGASNETIGAWAPTDQNYYENDFSKFDATIHHNLLEMELYVYRRFGMPTNKQKLMRKNFPTSGTTPHGVSYMVEGTRKSGDQNTSIGNTMINVLVHAYAMTLIGFPPSQDLESDRFRYRMIALGDDNLIVSPVVIAHERVEKIIMDLGLVPNIVLKDNINFVEFCSARFWPSETGRVLGPKIGRYLAKIGWMLRPPIGESRQAKEYRGTLLSNVDIVNHIPILCEVTRKILDVMREKRFIKDTEVKRYVFQPHQAVQETWTMIHDLYSISKSDVDDLLAIVARVDHLPAEINHWILSSIFSRDC